METIIQLVISGLLTGGVYALMAVGLTLVFGVLKIPNFSHGELVMVGMYVTIGLCQLLAVNPYVAIPLVAATLFLLGLGFERFLVRPTLGSGELAQVFMTVGVSFFLMNLCLMLFTGDYRQAPYKLAHVSWSIGAYYIPIPQFIAFAGALICLSALYILINYTYSGKAIRAVSIDRQTARLMGINVDKVYLLTFGLALALTGVSSALLTTLFPVFPTVGTYFVLIAFVVVVLGGLGSIIGAMVGGIVLGVVESLSGYYIGQGWNQAIYFAAFLIILIIRPQGLFGQRML